MATSDLSLSRVVHSPHIPPRTTTPVASKPTPISSKPPTTAPSFSTVFASIAAAAAASGATVASTAPAPASSTAATAASLNTPAAVSTIPADATDDSSGSPFGANPWLTDPTGSGPGPVTNYNPIYFATVQTAQTVAQMTGGTVVSENAITSSPGSPFQQNQPNLMVELPNGGLINPGLVADIYTHGWNQAFENQQVANEVAGAVPASTNT
jgi:hypothetical protein